MAVSVRVAMAVGPSGNWLVLFMHVMQRGRTGMGGSGAARTLETAVRNLSMTALTQSARVKYCTHLCVTWTQTTQWAISMILRKSVFLLFNWLHLLSEKTPRQTKYNNFL